MATYSQIQGDTSTMNEAQRNDAARAAGFTGWNDYQDNANRLAQGSQTQTNQQMYNPMATPAVPAMPSGGGVGASALGVPAAATLDLPGLYNSLTKSSGIADLENKAMQEQTAFNEAQSKINDNPFLSEADRVGRIQKLQMDYNNSTKATQDALAMKKADVQTQLDLASKQYDINSQASRDALSRFDSLLASGALAGASGSDIANLTSQTGLSSTMIQAAIKAAKAKGIQTQTINWDDGTNMGFAIIDQNTGDIISKQTVAPSKPTAAESKAAAGGTLASQNKANESSSAQAAILNYTQDRAAQAAASPEDFITLLLRKYPNAGLTAADAAKIRKITGQ